MTTLYHTKLMLFIGSFFLINYQFSVLSSHYQVNTEKYTNENFQCIVCRLFFKTLILQRKQGVPREYFIKMKIFICPYMKRFSDEECDSLVKYFMDVFLYTIDHKPDITSERICALLENCLSEKDFNWSVTIPPKKQPEYGKTNQSNENFTILHISDLHFDPDYTIGGNAECGKQLCCQMDEGKPKSNEERCGCWGDYRHADTPWHLLEETIKKTKEKKFDFVYFTGDIVSHRFWDAIVAKNSKEFVKINSYLKKNFQVPIYPVLGNHELYPVNSFPPSNVYGFSMNWLLKLAADHWSEMVGEDVSSTVLKGGYYTVSPKPGFRVIALNNNIASRFNYWLMYDEFSLHDQLQWLVNTLIKAEENYEKVHILSHMGNGISTTLTLWDREYSKIVKRFAHVINGQFNGHTHRDEFTVYFNDTQPIGVAFNGASITPWIDANPSFKYYTANGTDYSLIDFEEWTFNLTLANSKCTEMLQWYKLYSFREAYGVENLVPSEINKLLQKMTKNHSLLNDYFRYFYRNGDTGISKGCDDSCKKNLLCEIVTSVISETAQCRRFSAMYDSNL